MRVAFYLDSPTPQYLWFAHKAAVKARGLLKATEIILLTTKHFTRQVDADFDRVERLNLREDCFYGHRKCLAQSMIEGECLFLDVDCIVKRDVSHIFGSPFDVALCIRYMSKAVDKLPFNGGVSFSRCPEFWKDVAGLPEQHQSGSDTERRLSEVAMSDKYIVRALNGDIYNYPPKSAEEDVSGRAIVHYKGDRKAYLHQ